ncbi:hypothetical protein NDU88_006448 [Pleurodeles waltl]|uniref:Uncharacterized protein n=1 Tax=Pleurodeles waltl TaxID=8319 RepID=A0AAV7LRZ4_PLEWA|nr:hypothetical protein NDU88_006448 [Pleurodeles waltl]
MVGRRLSHSIGALVLSKVYKAAAAVLLPVLSHNSYLRFGAGTGPRHLCCGTIRATGDPRATPRRPASAPCERPGRSGPKYPSLALLLVTPRQWGSAPWRLRVGGVRLQPQSAPVPVAGPVSPPHQLLFVPADDFDKEIKPAASLRGPGQQGDRRQSQRGREAPSPG